MTSRGRDRGSEQRDVSGEQSHGAHGMKLVKGDPPNTDPTMQDERCVLQVTKRHFARYTPALVAELCGCSEDEFLAVAQALCENSGRERTSALVYAVGWTQHTVGVQNVRAGSIVQMLLGNMGRPGGGIMALRGHANIQGSTDIPTLYNILPGYIPMPSPDDGVRPGGVRGQQPGDGGLGKPAQLRGIAAQGLVGRRGHGCQCVLL